ncbi:MAG: response regulator transcription factor [Planctomycetota bacterium]|nr:response regulator transcription factor [Planctomycetota bacterium]MDA1248567.1 response regulator transcription factor [Planctomycetota bacterium]
MYENHQAAPVTIGLVDPLELDLFALTNLFNSQPGLSVVGTASTGEAGVQMLTEKRPVIAVVEIDLKDRSGFDLASELAMKQRDTRVIFYSAVMPDIFIEQALRSKAAGYVLKTDSLNSLLAAVREVSAGRPYFSEEIRQKLVLDPNNGQMKTSFDAPLGRLSDRQIEVLRNLAFGMSVKDVARKMHISVKSVDSHKYRIMQSLEIHDRVDLARFAIREGLVSAS